MTLIELLTVVFLGTILLSMVFLLYSNSSRSYIRQEATMEQMLNLRGGMAGISRQIRMAGNGYGLLGLNQNQVIQVYIKDSDGIPVGWFRYPSSSTDGVRPIFGTDGGVSGTDTITICSLSPDFATPLGMLNAEFNASSTKLSLENTIELPAGLDPSEVLKPNDYLALVPGDQPPILVESASDGTNLTEITIKKLPSSLPNGMSSLPAGTKVYNVKSVSLRTFSVDTVNNFLVMDSNEVTGDLMAEEIEDLQIAYCLGSDDPGDLSKYVHNFDGQDLKSKPVRTVRLVMISKSSTPDPYRGTFSAVTALNHTSVGAPDSYVRRFLENTVQLRNY
jgi:hypothetical protein